MKLLLLLLLIAVNCKGQIIDSTKPLRHFGTMNRLPYVDSIPLRNGVISTPYNFSITTDTGYIIYRFVIRPYGSTKPIAYLDKDSILVVNDSLETINVLIRSAIMTGEQMKELAEENNRLRNLIKQMKGDQAIYARQPININHSRVR